MFSPPIEVLVITALLLIACSTSPSSLGSLDLSGARGNVAHDEKIDDTATFADDAGDSGSADTATECRYLPLSATEISEDCVTTWPEISVQNETMVEALDRSTIEWKVTFSAVGGEVSVNPFVFSLTFHDSTEPSGVGGGMEDMSWPLTVSEDNGSVHGAVVESSNPGTKVYQIGNGSEGDEAVHGITPADPIVMTIVLDVSAMELGGGDTIGFSAKNTQKWSSADGNQETYFGSLLGTTFLFQ